MIIFDNLTGNGIGRKGERFRLFVSEDSYQMYREKDQQKEIKIINHAKVKQVDLHYDNKGQVL